MGQSNDDSPRAVGAWLGFAALVAAFWPVWAWFFRRLGDGGDEPWGLFALVVGGILVLRDARLDLRLRRLWLPAAVYVLGGPFLPPLVRAGLAMMALCLAFEFPHRTGLAGVMGLFLLSLPILASLEFYLGYPLRLITTRGAEIVLQATSGDVGRAGLALVWDGKRVLVDAPCAGVGMLWTGMVVHCWLAAISGMRWRSFAVALFGALAVILGANALRAAALFFPEAGVWPISETTHSMIGMLFFLFGLFGIGAVHRLVLWFETFKDTRRHSLQLAR